jgi:hypothetical protein
MTACTLGTAWAEVCASNRGARQQLASTTAAAHEHPNRLTRPDSIRIEVPQGDYTQ